MAATQVKIVTKMTSTCVTPFDPCVKVEFVSNRSCFSRKIQADKNKRQVPQLHGGFFNIAASLDAIDKWREQEEDEAGEGDGSAGNDVRSTRRNRSSISGKSAPTKTLGPANELSDDEIVRRLKTKDALVVETKTREGFRRFFGGIKPERLECILLRVFADPDKVRRRMELMSGFFADNS